jgi:eukaryotic-like serine/threonine-protein kinase
MAISLYYCDNCGAANHPQATACFACGWALQTTATAPASSQPPTPVAVQLVQAAAQQTMMPAAKTFNAALAPGYLLKQRYRIIGQVGKGGFGAVYKATDIRSNNRLLAVKEVNPSGQNPQGIAEATAAFKREALLLTGLAHQSLPHIYDHFSEAGSWYLAMDFIEGETLEERLSKTPGGRLPLEKALSIGIQLCSVLDYLHTRQQPIIFRDLKPGNIMLTPDGLVYLIDFGIARHFKMGQVKDTAAFGSPGYAAPEQYGKAQTTPRSDIYGLGATLHQLLTGDDPTLTPFHFAPLHLLHQVAPPGLEELIGQMLEMNESNRPADMATVRRELQRIAAQYRQRAGMPKPTAAPQAAASPQPVAAKAARQVKLKLPGLAKRPANAKRRLISTPSISRRTVVKGLAGLGGLTVAGGSMALLLRALEAAPSAPPHPQLVTIPPTPATPALGTTRYFVYHGHSAAVDAVAWNPVPWTGALPGTGGEAGLHNSRIASAGEDQTVQVWDAATGSNPIIYRGHTDYVFAVAWSPDGKLIASGGRDTTIQVWSVSQGVQVVDPATEGNIFIYRGHRTNVSAVAWSPDGNRIASGAWDNTVQVWQPTPESHTLTYKGHVGFVNTVAWSPDGKRIASGAWDDTVQAWDASTGLMYVTYRGHSSAVRFVAWSPDGKFIASGDALTVQVWNASTGEYIFTYRGHTTFVNAVAWSPDGKRIASASDDQTVQIWNAPSAGVQSGGPIAGGDVFTYAGHSRGVRAIAWSPDGKLIISGSEDHTAQVWAAK